MKRNLLIRKRGGIYSLLILTVLLVVMVFTGCNSSDDNQENETFTFTINVVEMTNPRGGFSLNNLADDEVIDVEFERDANNWWKGTFESSATELHLRLDGLELGQTPFGTSFVMTNLYNQIFIFGRDIGSVVYAVATETNDAEFFVLSASDSMELAGTFNNWSPMAMPLANAEIIPELIPSDFEQEMALNLFHQFVATNNQGHEFKILRDGDWAHGENAILLSFVIEEFLNPQPDFDGETVTFTFNYFRHDGRYNGWDLWLWRMLPSHLSGFGGFNFTEREINGETWASMSIQVPSDSQTFGFIVRMGDWERRNFELNFDMNRDADGNPADTELFFIHGERRYYRELPDTSPGMVTAIADWHNYIRATMHVIPEDFNADNLRLYDVTDGAQINIPIISAEVGRGRGEGGERIEVIEIYTADYELNPRRRYQIMYGTQPFGQAPDLIMRGILDGYYHANNRTELLGVTWSQASTTFRLWAPGATDVQVALYHELDQRMSENPVTGSGDIMMNGDIHPDKLRNPDELIPMAFNDETGVWHIDIERELVGYYYMFRVTFPDGLVEYAIDPYATAVTANGNLGAIISDDPLTGRGAPLRDPITGRNNLNSDGPNYMPLRRDPNRPLLGAYQIDHIIYELHIRDFSIHPSSGISDAHRGTYMAFTERGTTVNGRAGAPSTGLDHLIELGVTTVHLLPMYDQGSLNQLADMSFEEDTYATVSGVSGAMNWGYDPQNFNVPQGSFSTDPTDPALRIREMKAMINAMHEQGIRVVMDVVYNHTYSIFNGPFQRSVPNYFHRSWCDGIFSDGAAVGNEVASERPMVRQYIIDSLLFWQSEFGIDGFRFDLMRLHDSATMYEAVRQLRAVDPYVIIYGEPWNPLPSPIDHHELIPSRLHEIARELGVAGGVRPTDHHAATGQGFGVFNDPWRNAARGGNDDNTPGFITGAALADGRPVELAIWGNIRGNFGFVEWTSEMINYVSKHDNLIVFDNVSWSLGAAQGGIDAPGMTVDRTNGELRDQIDNWDFHRDPFAHLDRSDIMNNNPVRSVTLGTGLTLTSQGVPFLHAGDEFLRTKHGHRNTYNSRDFYNAIRWYQKEEFIDVHNYFAGLIQLRRERLAFRMHSRADIYNYYHLISASPLAHQHVVAYRIGEHAGGDSWRNIYVAMNGGAEYQTINLGNSTMLNVVADATRVGRNADTGMIEPFATIEAGEMIVLPPFSMIVAFDVAVD